VNQKKCPKCGEMNPGEAVMCWACYTPLTGAAVGAGGAGTAAVSVPGVAVHDEQERKKGVAPWQMGVAGLGVLALLAVGAKTMMGGDGGGGDPGATPAATPYAPPPPDRGPGPRGNPGVLPPTVQGPSTTVEPAADIPFSMASPPNPGLPWRIMAIVPNDPNTSPQRAASLAKFAKSAMGAAQNKPMQIYVFASRQAGQAFNEFQIPRQSNILDPSDYAQLSQLWPQCLARYEFNGGRETVLYPSRQGENWWARRS